MFNRKRLFTFFVFVLLLFFMMTFAGEPQVNSKVATRDIEFVDTFDNTTLSEQKIEVGGSVEVPEDPYHRNYVFMGWFVGDEEIVDFSNMLEDLTIETKYEDDINNNGTPDRDEDRYTVVFIDTFDNNTLSTQEILPLMSAVAPTVPEHIGVTFTGWDKSYVNVNSDLTINTIYATSVVAPNYYQVTFVDGDNSQVIDNQVVEEGTNATLPVAPIHSKRVFEKWEGIYQNVVKNETVTAIYTDDINENEIPDKNENTYTVSYEANIATSGEVPVDVNKYLTDLTYMVKDNDGRLALENAVFIGWSNVSKAIVKTLADETGVIKPGLSFKINNANVVLYAVFAEDRNNNGTPDYKDTYYTVTFTVDEEGSLTGETTFSVLEGLNFYDEVTVPQPNDIANDGYTFDEWTPSLPENDAIVEDNMTFNAEYVVDENNNEVPDDDDTYYTVTFTADEEGSLFGETTFKVLTGLKFYEKVTVPLTIDVEDDGYTFDEWTPSLPENDAIVEDNMTFNAEYVVDENNNEVPDDKDTYYAVTFTVDDEGSLTGQTTFSVLTGMPFGDYVTVPSPVNVEDDGYTFDKWDPSIPANDTIIEDNMTFNAEYMEDVNNNEVPDYRDTYHTVKFTVDNEGSLTGQTSFGVLTGMPFGDYVTVPTPIEVENDGYTFDKWNPAIPADDTVVNADMSFNAEYALDINENEVPDYRDTYHTVEFTVDEEGSLTGQTTFSVLTGLYFYDEVVVPTPVNVEDDGYAFDKWNPILPTDDTAIIADMSFNAVYALDINNNEIPDYRDTYHTVEFTVDEEGSLTGETSFEVLTGMPFEDYVTVPTPVNVEDDGYTFDKWDPEIPTDGTAVNANMSFNAEYEEDINENEVPDYRDTYHTVEFTVDEEGSLTGETTFEVLTGMPFGDYVTVPTPVNVEDDGYTFDKWNPTLPTDGTAVNADMTFNAEYEEDINDNEVPDYRDTYHTVEFTVDEEGSLTGETSFSVLTGLYFYDEVAVPTPVNVEDDGYAFDKWNPILPTDDAKVNGDMSFNAVYALDINNNEIPDYRDTYHTVEFTVDEEGSLTGETSFSVLTGMPFEDYVTVPTPVNVEDDGYTFDKWDPAIPADDTAVNADMSFNAEYEEDINENEVPDYRDTYHTVEFTVDEEGSLTGETSFEVLTGMPFEDYVTVPTPVNVEDDGYTFDKWNPTLPTDGTAVNADMSFNAEYEEDINENEVPDYRDTYHTVEFTVDEEGSLTGETSFSVLTGMPFEDYVTVPTPVNIEDDGYAFDKWNPEIPADDTAVNADMSFNAEYEEDINENEVPDYRDTYHTVEFTVDEEGSLTGETSFSVLTGLYFYDEVVVPTPVNVENDGYTFDKWNPALPADDAKVNADMLFNADYAKDDNNNEIPDYLENTYKVTYHKGVAISGNVPEDNNEYLEGESASVLGNTGSLAKVKAVFLGWSYSNHGLVTNASQVPTDLLIAGNTITIDQANVDLYAVFADDKNASEVPDYNEMVTLSFNAGNHGTFKTGETTSYEVLPGYDKYPVAPAIDASTDYVFTGWTPSYVVDTLIPLTNPTLSYTATYRAKQPNVVTTLSSRIMRNGKEVNGTVVEYGDVLEYTLTITNTGDKTGTVNLKIDKVGNLVNSTIANAYKNLFKESGYTTTVGINQKIEISFSVIVNTNVKEKAQVNINYKVDNGSTIASTGTEYSTEKTVEIFEQTETIKGSNIVIVLDESGSMQSNDRMMKAKEATNKFIDKVFADANANNGSTITVLTFGTEDGTSCYWDFGFPFVPWDDEYVCNQVPYSHTIGYADSYTSAIALKSSVNNISNTPPWASDTPYYIGLENAYNKLYGTNGLNSNGNKNVVIFLSDGKPENDDETKRAAAIANLHQDANGNKTDVYAIGFDVDKNSDAHQVLKTVASSSNKVYRSGADELVKVFDTISSEVANNTTKVQTSTGVAKIGDTIVADATHPISIDVNGRTYKSYKSLQAALNENILTYTTLDGYQIDASKFNAGDKIKFSYFSSITR